MKRSTSAVDDMVETMTKTSGFLKRHDNPISKIPQLTRDQVEVGTLLGYGTFSFVHEVQAFDIDADENDAAQKREEETRPSLEEQQNVQDLIARGEHGELAIKHLRQDLMESTLKFEEAAADLIVEAKYLAALDHPNIIKLRAVAKGGASAFESGQHDSFFLVIDKLHRTFKEKILEWQFLDDDSSMLMLSSKHCDAISISHDRELLLEKIDLGHQIAKALAYLHEHRLVYRGKTDSTNDNL